MNYTGPWKTTVSETKGPGPGHAPVWTPPHQKWPTTSYRKGGGGWGWSQLGEGLSVGPMLVWKLLAKTDIPA